jgi:hypothetical protein
MKGNIEVRFFMFLAELRKERNWPIPMLVEIEDEISGISLLERLDIPLARVEALLINGKTVWPETAMIKPGDRVAILPPGTPGPYRVMLGIRKTPTGTGG